MLTGGHLDVVQLLKSSGADIDSQDNRKVSCLMAAFRKGHVKVAKWMVKHVNQFPSDQELSRYISTVADKVSIIIICLPQRLAKYSSIFSSLEMQFMTIPEMDDYRGCSSYHKQILMFYYISKKKNH
jgi:ankyrin repeat protein